MPYKVQPNHPDCPSSRNVAVVKESDGKVMGCHPSQESARRQIRAIEANENSVEFRNLEDIDTKPPAGAAREAERGLRWREEHGRGGTEVGVARARDIANRANLSESTIKRMHSFFSRHESSSKNGKGFKPGQEGYPSAGRIAWALWGGDPGQSWAARKVQEFERARESNSIEQPVAMSNNGNDYSARSNMSDSRTVRLNITRTEEFDDKPTTEAVDLSKAERNCRPGGSCCDDCASEEEFSVNDAETFDGHTDEDKEEAGDKDKREFEWEGVLTVEGLPSGDGRMIAEGALEWRNLPVPLMLQTKTEGGHRGAEIAGSIVEIERVGQDIVGRGYFDSGEAGQEFKRLIEEGTMSGVSVDLDMVATEFRSKDGRKLEDFDEIYEELERAEAEGEPFGVLETVVQGRIMGATGTPFPAFQEAQIDVLGDSEREALVASGATGSHMVLRASTLVASSAAGWAKVEVEPESLVASAGFPAVPPAAWFDIDGDGDDSEFPPFTVYPDGRCFGVIAEYGSCHIGFDQCVTVPKPWDGFSHACNKTVLTDDGLVPAAPIYLNTVHPDMAKNASDAQTWYANTGDAVADVTLWDTPRGIVAAGSVRPSITEDQLRTFRGSDVSPDWRQIRGQLTMVGLLGVNVSGFIVERNQVLVASGAPAQVMTQGRMVDGELTALVAAGIPARPNRLEELETLYGELLHKFNLLTETLGVELKTEEEQTEEASSGPLIIRVPKKAAHSIKLIRK